MAGGKKLDGQWSKGFVGPILHTATTTQHQINGETCTFLTCTPLAPVLLVVRLNPGDEWRVWVASPRVTVTI